MGGTWGTLSAGGAALFFPALPVSFLAGALFALASVVCCAELEPLAFEPSGGIEAFDDDKRR